MRERATIGVSWSDRPWRRAALYGLGVSGRGVVRLLRSRGVAVDAFDSRARDAFDADHLAHLEADADIRLHLGTEPDDETARVVVGSFDGIVTSPGVDPERPLLRAARTAGVPVVAEVELAYGALDETTTGRHDVIAITGSNGKSTTTAMTGALLAAAGQPTTVCGNIGRPFSDAVAEVDETGVLEQHRFVVELSSFQLEATDHFRPRAAALLNLSPDHLDRHGDVAGYLAAKARIFANQTGDDVAVLNADDPRVAELPVAGRRRWFSRRAQVSDGCYLDPARGRVVEVVPGETPTDLFATDDVPVDGTHNLENAMAAALLARSRDASPRAIVSGLRGFRGLPHRLERVRLRDGVRWLDDSKGTNVGATLASLDGFEDQRVHLILGGRTKGADLGQLVDLVSRKALRVYAIGESEQTIVAMFEATHGAATPPVERCGTLERAVSRAERMARDGEVVLLSPACASFDQFSSFVERGETFQRLVRALDPPEGQRHGA